MTDHLHGHRVYFGSGQFEECHQFPGTCGEIFQNQFQNVDIDQCMTICRSFEECQFITFNQARF